jgi:hypothetical protein
MSFLPSGCGVGRVCTGGASSSRIGAFSKEWYDGGKRVPGVVGVQVVGEVSDKLSDRAPTEGASDAPERLWIQVVNYYSLWGWAMVMKMEISCLPCQYMKRSFGPSELVAGLHHTSDNSLLLYKNLSCGIVSTRVPHYTLGSRLSNSK